MQIKDKKDESPQDKKILPVHNFFILFVKIKF